MASLILARNRAGEVREHLFAEVDALCERLGIEPSPRPVQAPVSDPELMVFQTQAMLLDLTRAFAAHLDASEGDARKTAKVA